MSAALLVVEATVPAVPAAGTVVDIRVDRSTDPIGELTALLAAADAFRGFGRAVDELMGGDGAAALHTIDDALAILPGDENLRFVRTGALFASGDTEAGITEMRSLVAHRPTWEVVVRSFAAKGLIPVPEGTSIDTILG